MKSIIATTVATATLLACAPVTAGTILPYEPTAEDLPILPPSNPHYEASASGFYVGASAIYTGAGSDFDYDVWSREWDNSVGGSGFGGGAFVGYEWDLGQTYAALELNGGFLNAGGRDLCRNDIRYCDASIDAAIDFRLRVGVNAGNTSFGIFAGPSLGLLSGTVLTNPSLTVRPDSESWELGYVVGADITHDLGQNLFLRAEAGYRSYGGLTDTFRQGRYNESIDVDTSAMFAAVSVGWRF